MIYGYARCKVCGHIFEKTHTRQQICRNWVTSRGDDACHLLWSHVYYVKDFQRRKKAKRIKQKPKIVSKQKQMTTTTGCILIPKRKGRCDKYITCEHRRECLMLIPIGWNGFTAIDEKGYKKQKPKLDLMAQKEEFWGYHQIVGNI